ncbi:unnamed protein product [Calicophoron daubneyi]
MPLLSANFPDSGSESGKTGSKIDAEAVRWREERMRLRDYLISAGLGDAMTQLRKARVRDLLALTSSDSPLDPLNSEASSLPSSLCEHSLDESEVHGHEKEASQHLDGPLTSRKPQTTPSASDNNSQASPFELSSSTADDGLDVNDPETAEAIAEFELLLAQQGAVDKHSGLDENGLPDLKLTGLSKDTSVVCGADWDSMDEKELLTRFKEQYRAERSRVSRHSSGSGSPRHALDQQLQQHTEQGGSEPKGDLADASLNGDIDVKRPYESVYPETNANISLPPGEIDEVAAEYDAALTGTTTNNGLVRNGSKSTVTGSVTPSLGLGDLASLTVANESDAGHNRAAVAAAMDNLDGVGDIMQAKRTSASDSLSSNATNASAHTESSPWTPKYTLRSHFDSIRAVTFHPIEPMLVTASEDHTLKLWNLNKTVQAKKSTNFDVEPIYTFRGHDHPVLSLGVWANPSGSDSANQPVFVIYSGDLSGQLRSWRLPGLQLDPYDNFDPNIVGPLLRGHNDAIWCLSVRHDGVLLSASADGTACLWHTGPLLQSSVNASAPVVTHLQASCVLPLTTNVMASMVSKSVDFGSTAPVPTSVVFLQTEKDRFASGFTSGHVCLFDVETNKLLTTFQTGATATDPTISSVTCVVSHPQQPLVISAHEDRHIRLYDINSGKCVHAMVAHLDSVTSLSIDPQGAYLLSASHDCSIRLWNINKKTCIQEITSHRKKFGESINAVAFHPTKHYMASAGADALAKVFV